MGKHGVNIANFTLGRKDTGGDAIALLYVDNPTPEPVLKALCDTGLFNSVKPLAFDI